MVHSAPITPRERREAARVAVCLPLTIHFAAATSVSESTVSAELLEASMDGCGLAFLVAGNCHVPVGAAISMRVGPGPIIAGIVISRMGTHARLRVGVRIDAQSRTDVQALLRHSSVAAKP